MVENFDESYTGTWLGLSDYTGEMAWYRQGSPYYLNWIFGEPEITQTKFPGETCAKIASGSEQTEGFWSAEYCREQNAVICQKISGQACPDDSWVFRKIKGSDNYTSGGNKCYKFFLNGHEHLPWFEARIATELK